jgi:hypothetical protein
LNVCNVVLWNLSPEEVVVEEESGNKAGDEDEEAGWDEEAEAEDELVADEPRVADEEDLGDVDY